MNRWRRRDGFEAISDDIRTLEFAETLGVGSTRTQNAKLDPRVRLRPAPRNYRLSMNAAALFFLG